MKSLSHFRITVYNITDCPLPVLVLITIWQLSGVKLQSCLIQSHISVKQFMEYALCYMKALHGALQVFADKACHVFLANV